MVTGSNLMSAVSGISRGCKEAITTKLSKDAILERFAYTIIVIVIFFCRGDINVGKGMYVAEKCSENEIV